MELLKRLIRVINISYVVYVAIIVALYYALTTPVIVDPLIAFLLAGIVPGTDVVLAPETLLIILVDVFGLAVVAMLIGWAVRRRLVTDVEYKQPARRSSKSVRQLLAQTAIHRPVPEVAKAPPALKQSRAPKLMQPSKLANSRWAGYASVALATAGLLLLSAVLTVARYGLVILIFVSKSLIFAIGMLLIVTQFLLAAMVEGAAQIGRLLLRTAAIFIRYATWATVFLIVVIGVVIDLSIRLGRYLWRTARPTLERFDSWPEVMFRWITSRIMSRYKGFDTLQVCVMIVKDGIANLRRLFTK